MDFDEFKRTLEECAGGRSTLSEEAFEVGRKLSHLPD